MEVNKLWAPSVLIHGYQGFIFTTSSAILFFRRQSAEEREAERNAATKYLIKIQNAAVAAAGAVLWKPFFNVPPSTNSLPL